MSYAQCKKCGETFDTEKMEHSRVDIYDITVPVLAGAVPRGWVADGGYLCKECGAALKRWLDDDRLSQPVFYPASIQDGTAADCSLEFRERKDIIENVKTISGYVKY